MNMDGEVWTALIFFIILLIILILLMLRKRVVVVASLTVATDKPQYTHADTVKITGEAKEDSTPKPDVQVGIKVIDPDGGETELPDETTDEEGKFASEWEIPDDAVPGAYKVEVSALGVSATTSFILNR